MSIKLMSQVWEKKVTHSEQAILLAMADYAGDDGKNCYPSYEKLAWKTDYSERQVARIIKGLCKQGILVVIKQASQHNAPHYWIRLDKATDKEPFRDDTVTTLDSRVDTVTTLDDGRVDISDSSGWTSETSRVDIAMSTYPSVNHYIKPPIERERERESPPPATHQAMPGTSMPKQRRAKRDADNTASERDRLGISALQLTVLTDAVLDRMNATALAELDTDMGNEELNKAQGVALALASLGHSTEDSIDAVFDTFGTHDWRGLKGEAPTYKSIVDHAKELPGKIAAARKAKSYSLDDYHEPARKTGYSLDAYMDAQTRAQYNEYNSFGAYAREG